MCENSDSVKNFRPLVTDGHQQFQNSEHQQTPVSLKIWFPVASHNLKKCEEYNQLSSSSISDTWKCLKNCSQRPKPLHLNTISWRLIALCPPVASGSMFLAAIASTFERLRFRFPSELGWTPGMSAPKTRPPELKLELGQLLCGGDTSGSFEGFGVP